MEWDELASVLNKELRSDDTEYTSSTYRKPYQQAKRYYEAGVFKQYNDENSYFKELQVKKRELERSKIQFRDERNAWQKQNYIDARVEQKLDYLCEELSSIGKTNFEKHETPLIDGNNEMIVMLSDLHIGQTFDSVFGKYNSDIAKERLERYLNKVIQVGKTHNVRKIHLVSIGDQISGNIHKSIAVTNRENVIEQIKTSTELISSFAYELTKEFEIILFYNVVGNHSRLERKDDSLHDERLDDIIGWATELSLAHIENFHYMKQRNLDSGIVDINVCGKSYIGVHGDFDAMSKQGVSNLSLMLGWIPYAVLRGHMHYPAMNELNGIKVIQSGSLPGAGDQHTVEMRLNGKPSQTALVCNDKGIECIYNVELQ